MKELIKRLELPLQIVNIQTLYSNLVSIELLLSHKLSNLSGLIKYNNYNKSN